MEYILEHGEGRMYRKFFEDIASIPHESFKEKALSDYIMNFAKKRGLWCNQDEVWNVIIKKPASPGYEAHEPVMIQGHIDMVCVKTADSSHSFDTDPLQLYVEDGFLRAKDTTLGADCGHGISYMLSILDDKSLKHPPLECLFTVQEEVGVGGPKYLDYSLLSAKRLIFTDSMGEGSPEMSTTSVLGGSFIKEVKYEKSDKDHFYKITTGGMSGGHAAVDINKGRANAIKIMARVLYELMKSGEVNLVSFDGGTMRNNVPNIGEMVVCTDIADISKIIEKMDTNIKIEHAKTDQGFYISLEEAAMTEYAVCTNDTKDITEWLMQIPTGTYMASPDDPSFPLTSRNMGKALLEEGKFIIDYQFRTSIRSHIEMMFDEQQVLCNVFGAFWEKAFEYPGYVQEEGTPMYKTYEEVYKAYTGKALNPIHIHAGTDVGTLIDGMGGLDVIGIGPNTYKFHTPQEELDLASYDRAYKYMTGVLEKL